MASNKKFTDDLIRQLGRTAIVLKLESNFTPAVAEVLSESEMLGSIIAQYFKNTGRRIAETAYATFDAAGLTVEVLPFSELWRRSHPEENDPWATEENDLDGENDDN